MNKNNLIVFIGLPGSGKTTLGKKVAEQLSYSFYDMDDTMPESMKSKMKNGEPISEEERDNYRKVWLEDIRQLLEQNSVVASLFLIKEHYRAMIHEHFPQATLINIAVPIEVLKQRLDARPEHFFTSERLMKILPANEEVNIKHIDIDGAKDIESLVEEVLTLVPNKP